MSRPSRREAAPGRLIALPLGTAPRSGNRVVVDQLVAAARRCFARSGVAKTRMGHIADEAGIVRQTAYEYVSGRAELVELALIARTRELLVVVEERVGQEPRDGLEALVAHVAAMIEVCRDDTEFAQTAEALHRAEALRFLAASAEIHDLLLGHLRPRFSQARAQRRLRDDMEDAEMVSWIQTSTTPLAVRMDLGEDGLRHVVRTFVVAPFVAMP